MGKQMTQTVYFCWLLMFLLTSSVFLVVSQFKMQVCSCILPLSEKKTIQHWIKTVTKYFFNRKRRRKHTRTSSTHHQLPMKCWAHQHEDKQLTQKHLTFLSIFKVIQTAPPQPNHCCHPEAIMSGKMNGWLHCTHTIQLQVNRVSRSNTPLALYLCFLSKMLSAEKVMVWAQEGH